LRVLHTSDLHLKHADARTLNALECILDLARREDVDAVTIAGDMFDSSEDANKLRPLLRKKLSDNGFDILVLPGNHDVSAFSQNTFYGNDVKLLTEQPVSIEEYEDVLIAGVPFRENLDEEAMLSLYQSARRGGTKILLLHCTLDLGFSTSSFGEERTTRYMPVSTAMLSELGYDYVLAGHFHSTFSSKPLANGGLFVYPGSPVSLTRKEVGPRSVYLLDTEKGRGYAVELPTFYYDELTLTITPGSEDESVSELERWVDDHSNRDCEVSIVVTGYTLMPEGELKEMVSSAAKGLPHEFLVVGIENILQYPIYKRFKEILLNENSIADKNAVDMMVLGVISQLAEAGRLRL